MNLRPRHAVAAVTLALASLAAAPAFAQSNGYNHGSTNGYHGESRSVAVPVYAQPAAPVAQPVYVAPAPIAQPVVVVSPPAAPFAQGAFFAQRTRAQMNQIERAAREGVARGQLRPQIFGALNQDRTQIEFMLNRSMRDGIVRPNEARRIDAMLGEMNQLSAQFQARGGRWGRHEGRADNDGRGFAGRGEWSSRNGM